MSSMAQIFPRAGNAALQSNKLIADIDITTAASDFLWMVFSVMAATCLGTAIWAAVGVQRGNRTFHNLTIMITGTASIAYFCMASDLGDVAIPVEFNGGSLIGPNGGAPTRSIWYARYIDWTITTPLLLLELLLVTGLPLSDIVLTIFADLVMIITGLIGSLVSSQYKWGLYAIGCFAMFYVFYMLYGPARASSHQLGSELARTYIIGASILSFLWLLYPVAWGLADGGNVISPTGEMVFYGVLDLFAKPVFALVHLFSMRGVDYSALQLHSGKYSEFASSGGAHNSNNLEKGGAAAAAAGAGHGTHRPSEATMAAGHGNNKVGEMSGGDEVRAAPEVHNGTHNDQSTVQGH